MRVSWVLYLHSKLLQSPDVDGSLLRSSQIAGPNAQIRCGTDHATGQTQGVVGQDHLCCAVVVLEWEIFKRPGYTSEFANYINELSKQWACLCTLYDYKHVSDHLTKTRPYY